MNKLKFLPILLFILLQSAVFATAPVGYYTSSTLDGKNTAALRTALETIITNGQSVVTYDGLWTAYATTDINPSTGKVWDVYSNCAFNVSGKSSATTPSDQKAQCGTYSVECDCYNREHSIPQSWFSEQSPMVSDLFHVYPTDGKVNGMRSNYPFGEVGSATYTSGNGSKLGTSDFSGYTGIVFEPIDEYKGDFARTYFYMATRYASVCESWSSGAEVVFGSANLGFTSYAVNLFLAWSRQDPVSAKEIARNDAVYGIQNNRNPFIDYPGLEEYIWGNKTTQTFSTTVQTVTKPTITTPASSSVTTSTASLGGNITSTGNGTITESGIFYSTTNGFADGAGTKVTGNATSTGAFTVPVSGLNLSSTYYFKAFATNSAGTSYTSQASFTTKSATSPTIITGSEIATGATLNFGTVTKATTRVLQIKSATITGNLTVTVSGAMFSANTTGITLSEANNGYNLLITYNPTSSGSHTGTLIISGGGLSPDYSVSLSGTK